MRAISVCAAAVSQSILGCGREPKASEIKTSGSWYICSNAAACADNVRTEIRTQADNVGIPIPWCKRIRHLKHVTKAEVKPVFGAIGPKFLIVRFEHHLRMKPERHSGRDDAFVIERIGRKPVRDFLLRIESFISNERG